MTLVDLRRCPYMLMKNRHPIHVTTGDSLSLATGIIGSDLDRLLYWLSADGAVNPFKWCVETFRSREITVASCGARSKGIAWIDTFTPSVVITMPLQFCSGSDEPDAILTYTFSSKCWEAVGASIVCSFFSVNARKPRAVSASNNCSSSSKAQ